MYEVETKMELFEVFKFSIFAVAVIATTYLSFKLKATPKDVL